MAFKINSKTVKSSAQAENTVYFNSDEEFTNFCVAPFAIIKRSEDGTPYYEGEYSEEYKKCIKEGKTFIIKDENSLVYKRQCVIKRVLVLHNGVPTQRDAPIQLEVQGLQQYVGEELELPTIKTLKNHIMFDEKTMAQLGHYVYMLVDSRDGKPFYVGKGQNNRVFDHIRFAYDYPDVTSDKCDMIRAIGAENVKHVILTHGLASENEAYKIEAIAIDLLNYVGISLSNEVSGHEVAESGIMTTDEIKRLYSAERLDKISDECVIININGQYNRAMDYEAIYKATREAWRIGRKRTKILKYVLSEYRGLIVEVFEVDKWYEVERTYGLKCRNAGKKYIAYGFNGKRAPDYIRNLYINKSIVDRKVKGRANPISYAESINKT